MPMKLFRFFSLIALVCFFACTRNLTGDEPSISPGMSGMHRVSEERALAELHSVLESIDGIATRGGALRDVVSLTRVKSTDVFSATRSDELAEVEDLVYIANFADGQGYAILGADDRLAPVIAVTEEGSLTPEEFSGLAKGDYDSNEVPLGFVSVVDYVVNSSGSDIIPIFPPVLPPVVPTFKEYGPWETEQITSSNSLLPMKWHQDAPYNMNTPAIGGQSTPVGCVAVALGQIITWNYFNGRRPLPATIGTSTIDWNTIFSSVRTNIRGKRTYGATEIIPETEAIARLLREIGREVNMVYGPDGSLAYDAAARGFLVGIGYRSATLNTYSSQNIESYLANGPFYISADRYDEQGKDKVGHAWVIDGICKRKRLVKIYNAGDAEPTRTETERVNLVHCSFGWGAKYDGYFYSQIFDLTEGPVLKDGLVDGSDLGKMERNYKYDRSTITYSVW